MKTTGALFGPLLLIACFMSSGTARACDFDLVNATNMPMGEIRLYNQANRYLGTASVAALLNGDKFRFSRRRMRSGYGAWPDTCDEAVYIDMVVGQPGATTIDNFGGQHCRIKKQIRRLPDATLDVDNRELVVIAARDLARIGACQDR